MRTRKVDESGAVIYGNLYNDLLNYVIFAALLFYVLTVAGIFALRAKRPDLDRPYRAFGFPVVPALYIVAATAIMVVLLLYQTKTTGVGLVIVLIGIPVYWLRSWWLARSARSQ
jgi:APA family basic amino acid/polyamine antiporter